MRLCLLEPPAFRADSNRQRPIGFCRRQSGRAFGNAEDRGVGIRLLLVLMVALPLAVAAKEVYRWKNAEGNWVYSDSPHPGAQKMELGEPTVIQSHTPTPPPSTSNDNNGGKQQHTAYQSVALASPTDGQNIHSAPGRVPIAVETKPPLQDGDRVQAVVDGSPKGPAQASAAFDIDGVNRGTHKIGARILDAQGKVLVTTDTVTVYMHQPSVINKGRTTTNPGHPVVR